MYFNQSISRFAHRCVRGCCCSSTKPRYTELSEHSPLLGQDAEKPKSTGVANGHCQSNGHGAVEPNHLLDVELTLKDCEELGTFLLYLLLYPSSLVFTIYTVNFNNNIKLLNLVLIILNLICWLPTVSFPLLRSKKKESILPLPNDLYSIVSSA